MKRLSPEEISSLVRSSADEQCGKAVNVQAVDVRYFAKSGILVFDWTVEMLDEQKLVYTTLCGFNVPGLILNGAHLAYTHYTARQQSISGGIQVITHNLPPNATAYLDCVIYDLAIENASGCRIEVPVIYG